MITNNELFKKYGNDIVFLFKGNEPYSEAHGYPAGVLIEKDNKVLCYECEEWMVMIGGHINKKHDLSIIEYKEKYGFNKHAPLCSKQHSQALSEASKLVREKKPWLKSLARKSLEQGVKTNTLRGRAGDPRVGVGHTMQKSNNRNTCPEQMIQRLKLMQAKFGENVGLNIIRQYDPGLDMYGRRHYGSFNKWKEAIGMKIDTSSKKKEISDLIYDLRNFIKTYGYLPWDSITKERLHGFPHSIVPYEREWGGFARASFVCGITREDGGWLTCSGKRKAKWILIDE